MIPQEDVVEEDGALVIPRRVPVGDYVRPRGEDIKAGETGAAGTGRSWARARSGCSRRSAAAGSSVVKRPRVGILSTGDEIADLGTAVGPGQIRNSNSYSLMAQVIEAGGEPVLLGVAPDDLEAIETRLRWGLGCDVLISSAGVSVGEHDFVKAALARLGAEQHLWLVDMRPGKPIAFATIPVAPRGDRARVRAARQPGVRDGDVRAVRPARPPAHGRPRPAPPARGHGARARAHRQPGRRRGYLRVTLTAQNGGYGARLTGDQSSGILRSMVDADGLAVVPGNTSIAPGSEVHVIVLRHV